VAHPDARPTNLDGPLGRVYAAEISRAIALAMLLTGSAAAAEDLAHDVFVDAIARDRREPGFLRDPAWPWLRLAITRRALRWRQRMSREMDRLIHAYEAGDDSWDPAHLDLLAALRRLPPRMRACVVLHYQEDLPAADVAIALGCAERTVEAQLYQARKRLATELRRSDQRLQSAVAREARDGSN
jgi:RNA polymerase sigma factor (sigma-70 family)